jgi:hypothetical protein
VDSREAISLSLVVVLETWQDSDAIPLCFENLVGLKRLISLKWSKESYARDSENGSS